MWCKYFVRLFVVGLLLIQTSCSALGHTEKHEPEKGDPRTQLSVGYSMLYEEADGIPKLKWLLMFKDKPEEMGNLTRDLIDFYRHLAETMQKLAKLFPGMRIDVKSMSDIEAAARKAIGEDTAKDIAPVVGKSGVEFEREALLMFYNSLNEQRHLVGVMLEREPDAGLRKFLETTKAQLETRYARVEGLLNKHYFVH